MEGIVVCMWISALNVYPKSLKFTAHNRPFREENGGLIRSPPKLVEAVGAYDSDGCRMDPGNNLG
jgi:hypothetical protein